MRKRYLLPFFSPAFVMFSFFVAATVSGFDVNKAGVIRGTEKVRTGEHIAHFDVVHEQRIRFAAEHGVAAPAALAAAVKHSPMANLLISVAIEESLGNPVAVGASGEKGAWQVKASKWGFVPEDIHKQAGQAERIIGTLLIRAKGDEKKALAHYNGGTSPPDRSYRYAERILKRADQLQVAVNFFSPKGLTLWQI